MGRHPTGRRLLGRAFPRFSVVVAVVALGAFLSAPIADAHAAGPLALRCSIRTLQVRIADPGPADQSMWGQLCYRGNHEPVSVQLLVHGATYDHLYWNFPYRSGYYSYVDAATAAGYATFDIDRIGDGGSSRPPSTDLDLNAGAVALHDAITALRSGTVDGHAFARVIAVGHSIGSFETWLEAASYHDVDAVIATGALHALSPEIGVIEGALYPAQDDPKFAGSGLDGGYLTSVPGTRAALFYDSATTDPNVPPIDESDKDTVTVPELVSATSIIGLAPAQQPSYQITVPVLAVVGQDDALFCQGVTVYDCASSRSVRVYESQYYAPGANLKVVVIPKTGHAIALSVTAPIADAAMIGWALSVVAP